MRTADLKNLRVIAKRQERKLPAHLKCALVGLALSLFQVGALAASPLRIVAIGASNTSGWLIGEASAYPALLESMLKARGVDVEVKNAGVLFDTTARMLARLDTAVPNGTTLVILQPGGNDLRFFGSSERRSANIEAIKLRLRARSIPVVVYDQTIPWRYVFDGIHLTPAGHRMIATALYPEVTAILSSRNRQSPPAGHAKTH